jgi:hypothetical protein
MLFSWIQLTYNRNLPLSSIQIYFNSCNVMEGIFDGFVPYGLKVGGWRYFGANDSPISPPPPNFIWKGTESWYIPRAAWQRKFSELWIMLLTTLQGTHGS